MIFEPRTIKDVTFRNRVLRSSVGGRMAAYDGTVTDVWSNFEQAFADGGVGGIISTTFSTNRRRQTPFEYPSLSEQRFVAPLKRHVAEIKARGCPYIIQIGDPGAATQLSLFGEDADAMSSSSGFEFLYGYRNRRVAMSPDEIRTVIGEFADAAARAREAGADGIEITAEKGYLIHQFLNPGLNRRTDAWGGTAERRFRLLEEIVTAVRAVVGPDYLLGVRLAARDFNYLPYANFLLRFPWAFPLRHHIFGNDLPTTLTYGKRLKELGVDLLHVVTGTGFPGPKGNPGAFPLREIKLFYNATRHLGTKAAARATLLNLLPERLASPLLSIGWREHAGVSLEEAEAFRDEVGLPVITNGGYQSRSSIELGLATCDFVSMARALIATPDLLDRYRDGAEDPEESCTFCNRCCARSATSPLGCYEPARYGGDLDRMVQQIMAYNTPVRRPS